MDKPLEEFSQLNILYAHYVLGMAVELISIERYPLTIYAFYYDWRSGRKIYTFDANACNAMLYRDGVNPESGCADPLPHYCIETKLNDWSAISEILEPVESSFEFNIRWNSKDKLYSAQARYKEQDSLCSAEDEELSVAVVKALIMSRCDGKIPSFEPDFLRSNYTENTILYEEED